MNPPWDDRFEPLLRLHLDLTEDSALGVDDDLFARGLDSIAIVSLVVSAEETYGIVIPDEALDRETFQTPGSLWTAISGLLAQGSGVRSHT
jgi:acyl carrier protein